ncbi:hypothetical protein SAMN06264346_1021 [Chryseobacterium profundimaris]|uniref:Transposase n=1 Tax=Chryseobacterium profundimaris TaxID=1387275 RepID=A0ABY1NG58_9FLAO|nr:hypothetical protein SAMN06264346_1021 [Chryseobacterium profundimaris]
MYLAKSFTFVYWEKGSQKKLALIAVCNKLLRICFGVVKNKIKYMKGISKCKNNIVREKGLKKP